MVEYQEESSVKIISMVTLTLPNPIMQQNMTMSASYQNPPARQHEIKVWSDTSSVEITTFLSSDTYQM